MKQLVVVGSYFFFFFLINTPPPPTLLAQLFSSPNKETPQPVTLPYTGSWWYMTFWHHVPLEMLLTKERGKTAVELWL